MGFSLTPKFADPVMGKSEAADLARKLLSEAVGLAGRALSATEAQAVLYHLKASPAYLGVKGDGLHEILSNLRPEVISGWWQRNLKIKTKEATLVPFTVNIIQWRILLWLCGELSSGKYKLRAVILKARQFGVSTEIQALFCFLMAFLPNLGCQASAATVAHDDDATTNLRAMQRRFLDYLQTAPNVRINNDSELIYGVPFETGMSFGCAKNKELKRSFTFQLVHKSEKAFWPWPEKTDLSLMQTVPKEEEIFSLVFSESTANGSSGAFYNDWSSAEKKLNGYSPLFFGWHEFPGYTVKNYTQEEAEEVLGALSDEELNLRERCALSVGQLLWRRAVLEESCGGDEALFKQEYPAYPRQAFQTSGRPFFDMEIVSARIEAVNDEPAMFQGSIRCPLEGEKV